mgnify:CR=1 FL=1
MRLLFVEDEPDLREVLKKQLQGSGYSVDACGDGLEALECLADQGHRHRPQVHRQRGVRGDHRDRPRRSDHREQVSGGADDRRSVRQPGLRQTSP